VQFYEALVAKEVAAILTQNAGRLLLFHFSIPKLDIQLGIVIIRFPSVIDVLRVEVRPALATWKALYDSHPVPRHVSPLLFVAVVAKPLVIFEGNCDGVYPIAEIASDLLHILGLVRLSLSGGMGELKAIQTEKILALFALELG